MNQDFKIYSTYSDLLATTNKWKFCSYNVLNVGYPGYCGVNSKVSVTNMWTGFTSNTPKSMPRSTEIWIQVFPYSTPYTIDLIQNGDFELLGSNFNQYGVPVGWQVSPYSTSSNIATIKIPSGATPTLQGSPLAGESGSHCGISHVLVVKPVNVQFGGINQTVYVPSGNYISK